MDIPRCVGILSTDPQDITTLMRPLRDHYLYNPENTRIPGCAALDIYGQHGVEDV